LKVLHIISGDLWAGAETQVYLLLKALRREKDLDVRVMVFNEGILHDRLTKLGIGVFLISETSGFPKMIKRSLNAGSEFKPDLVVSHGYKESIIAALIKLKCKSRLITMFHGLSEVYSGLKQVKSSIFLGIQTLIARCLSDGIITISDTLASELGFSKFEKQRAILNCANSSSVAKFEDRPNSPPRILVVGRLVKIKRVDLAIEAMSLISNSAVLDIVGDGPEMESLRDLCEAKELNQKVNFLGFREDAGTLIAKADILFLCSDHEGVPTVILEAAAAGVPIVSTDLAGIKEALARLPGYPVYFGEKGSAESFSKTLDKALAAKRRGKNATPGSDFKKWFTPEAVARQHLELYKSLCTPQT